MKRISAKDTHEIGITQDNQEITASDIGTKRYLDINSTSFGASPLIISIDNTSTANTTYYGWAETGTVTSAASWKILREVRTGSDTDYRFAGSSALFSHIWDNRAGLSYG